MGIHPARFGFLDLHRNTVEESHERCGECRGWVDAANLNTLWSTLFGAFIGAEIPKPSNTRIDLRVGVAIAASGPSEPNPNARSLGAISRIRRSYLEER